MPIRHKQLVCSPLLGPINLSAYLGEWVDQLTVGGESGSEARVCSYEWGVRSAPAMYAAGDPLSLYADGRIL